MVTYHRGVWPPRKSVSVFFASFPNRAAQYGFCLPIVFRLGRFFARSMIATRVPIAGPSTDISAKIPAAWWRFVIRAALEAIMNELFQLNSLEKVKHTHTTNTQQNNRHTSSSKSYPTTQEGREKKEQDINWQSTSVPIQQLFQLGKRTSWTDVTKYTNLKQTHR